jgi:hypothetical protein
MVAMQAKVPVKLVHFAVLREMWFLNASTLAIT